MEDEKRCLKRFYNLLLWYHRINCRNARLGQRFLDKLYEYVYRPAITDCALTQLAQYRTVYSTRLRGIIGASLLGREVYFIDNNYGKLGHYYDTWLADLDNIRPLEL